jgi:guanine deaminase
MDKELDRAPEALLLGGAYDVSKADAYLGTILTFTGDPGTDPEEPQNVELYDPGLLIVATDGTIQSVEQGDGESGSYNTYDYRGYVIMAGFVDTHVHYVQMDAIAAFGEQIPQWLRKYIYRAEKKFKDDNHTQAVVEFFLDTLLANGTTTASVYSTQIEKSADLFFAEADKRNMRMLTGKMLMDNPVNTDDDFRDGSIGAAIDSSRRLAKKWHGTGRQLYSVNPRFAINCTGDMLAAAGRLYGEKIEGKSLPLWMHTHLSENKEEEEIITKRLFASIMGEPVPGGTGASDTVQTYTDVYRYYGLVGPRTVFGHCIEINGRDRQNLGRAGASIAHCPTSNFFLGSGMFNLRDAVANNVRIGMGTDCGAGTSYSLLATMGASYKSQAIKASTLASLPNPACPHRGSPPQEESAPAAISYPKLTAWRAFYLATLGGARALYLDQNTSDLNIGAPIGSLRSGNAADFVVLDLAATPVIKRRLERIEPNDPAGKTRNQMDIWHEKLFALMMLGDDRVVKATYVMGKNSYQRSNPN